MSQNPSQINRRGPLLQHLDEVESLCEKGDPTLGQVVKVFGADGHYVLMTFLIIPFLQPIPMMGLSTIFGLLIAVISVLGHLKRPPWVPAKLASKTLKANTVFKIAEASERVFEKISTVLKPRWGVFFTQPFRITSTFLLVFNAVLLALPLPIPFSNAFPAWMIAFQALAHLEEDGAFIVLSYIQTAACLIYFYLITRGVGTGLEFLGF